MYVTVQTQSDSTQFVEATEKLSYILVPILVTWKVGEKRNEMARGAGLEKQ